MIVDNENPKDTKKSIFMCIKGREGCQPFFTTKW